MKFLCVHSGHDFNVTTYDSKTSELHYIKEERHSKKKHDEHCTAISKFINKNKFKADVVAITLGSLKDLDDKSITLFSQNYKNIKSLELEWIKNIKEIESVIKKNKHLICKRKEILENYVTLLAKTKMTDVPICWVHHDYCHILSGWISNENFKESDYGISIDGGGPDFNNKLILKNPFDMKNLKILFNSRWIRKNDNNDIEINWNSLGGLFENIGICMNMQGKLQDFAGKIMGLQAYGKIDENIIRYFKEKSKNNILKFKITNFWFESLNVFLCMPDDVIDPNKRPELIKHSNTCNFKNKNFLNLVTTFHKIWEEIVLLMFKKFIPKKSKIVYSGGCAQNTVANAKFLKEYPDLHVVPHCYDGGLSLGCLAFLLLKYEIKFPEIKNFPYMQSDQSVERPSKETIQTIAKELAKGKIIGWYQGNGEIGPRALGNRSILMNPSIKDGKDKLNSKVKHREHWRPYAPSVLEEFAKDWFDIHKSKHMMFAAKVKKEKQKIIPAVTHEDGTSRIQTIEKEDNEDFYELIKEFYKLTKIPMLLNTSLNEGGGPIVGNTTQAKTIFENSGMDILCIGDKIIYKNKFIL